MNYISLFQDIWNSPLLMVSHYRLDSAGTIITIAWTEIHEYNDFVFQIIIWIL